jgi:hypothetical protein
MIVDKMKNIKQDIRSLLLQDNRYRDDDALLVCRFYYNKCGGEDAFKTMSAISLLNLLASKALPFPDYITRVRRKLQEQEPELRGTKWAERHSLEEETSLDIHNL